MSATNPLDRSWDTDDFSNSSLLNAPRIPATRSPPRSRRHVSSNRNSDIRLVYEELKEANKQLRSVKLQLQAETFRATEAEEQVQQVTAHLKRVNDARIAAQRDAVRANEELKLYKIQYSKAQAEIFRAQGVLEKVDQARYDAEKEAAEARTNVRRLNQTIVVQAAKEEGRRAGLREGLERGRLLGFQEARMMAQLEDEQDEQYYDDNEFQGDFDDVYRPRSRYIESSDEIRPPEPPRDSTPPHTSPPTPVPPPDILPTPNIRPRSFHNSSPVRHPPITIPPDGYIPSLDADQQIRIPPPHELSRPPPTPERMQSPPLPRIPDQDPLPVRPRTAGSQRTHRNHAPSSPGSNSTTLSQFDMVNDPEYPSARRSPLSIIPEVLSTHTSPNPQSIGRGHDLRHQSSWGGSSRRSHATTKVPTPLIANADLVRMDDNSQQHPSGPYTRPRTTSSSSGSLGPTNIHRLSSLSTVPDINIHPPSRPQSDGTPRMENGPPPGYLTPTDRPHDFDSSISNSVAPISGILQDNQLPQGFVPSGGYTPVSTSGNPPIPGDYHATHFQTPRSHTSSAPVIPDISLYRNHPEDDALSSVETLTTPPPNHRSLSRTHSREFDLDPLMTPPGHTHPSSPPASDWASASRAASEAIPIVPSVASVIPPPGVYSTPNTNGNTGSNGNVGGGKAPAGRKKGKKR
ncbi:hypothetical protein BDZ94DRAFT_1249062 [Collybia nuda]|uniref:Uncharacterized protein n=1 Tax=Collybia nuda TaxID=64659 RepID=A0A9P5YDK5_9AGAR|nr:hypothetical protein BDZ94DRAFT_1249062 [Collybia nuda]